MIDIPALPGWADVWRSALQALLTRSSESKFSAVSAIQGWFKSHPGLRPAEHYGHSAWYLYDQQGNMAVGMLALGYSQPSLRD
jgi:hypothetical protein